jgi:hypothetical protein
MHAKIDRDSREKRPNSYIEYDGARIAVRGFCGATYRQMRAYEEMYPPLEKDELLRLVRLAQAGDKDAMETIIKHHARKIMLFAIQAHTGRRRSGKPDGWGTANAGLLTMDECISIATSAIYEATMRFKEGTYSPVAGEPVRFSSWVNLIILQRISAEMKVAKRRQDNYADEPDLEAWQWEGYRLPNSVVAEGPETIVAREHFWEIVTRVLGEEGAKMVEEYQGKLTAVERNALRGPYTAAIARLREGANPQELEALRKAILEKA